MVYYPTSAGPRIQREIHARTIMFGSNPHVIRYTDIKGKQCRLAISGDMFVITETYSSSKS